MTNGRWANPLPVGLITMCSNSVEKSVPWWKSRVRFLSLGSLLSILNDREPCGCCLLSSSWVPKKVMCTLQSSRKEWILWNVMAFMATWRCCCLPSSGAHSFQITQCFAPTCVKKHRDKKRSVTNNKNLQHQGMVFIVTNIYYGFDVTYDTSLQGNSNKS